MTPLTSGVFCWPCSAPETPDRTERGKFSFFTPLVADQASSTTAPARGRFRLFQCNRFEQTGCHKVDDE